jgi:hypothetical protein
VAANSSEGQSLVQVQVLEFLDRRGRHRCRAGTGSGDMELFKPSAHLEGVSAVTSGNVVVAQTLPHVEVGERISVQSSLNDSDLAGAPRSVVVDKNGTDLLG